MPDYCDPVLRTESLRNCVDRLIEKYNDLKEETDDDREILDGCIVRVNSHSLRFNADRERIQTLTNKLNQHDKILKSLLEINLYLLQNSSKAGGPNDRITLLTGLFKNLTLDG